MLHDSMDSLESLLEEDKRAADVAESLKVTALAQSELGRLTAKIEEEIAEINVYMLRVPEGSRPDSSLFAIPESRTRKRRSAKRCKRSGNVRADEACKTRVSKTVRVFGRTPDGRGRACTELAFVRLCRSRNSIASLATL
jgi:hypothetical protein